MSNVRIGPDGSIIKDDEVISTGSGTVIRDDGTIETTNIGGTVLPPVRTIVNTPPVSPLENQNNRRINNEIQQPIVTATQTPATVSSRVIAEKEYDIQMIEGRIRNSIPKQWIIATSVLCILGVMGLYFLFLPAVVTGIMVIVGLSKKSELEKERERMVAELDNLRDRNRR